MRSHLPHFYSMNALGLLGRTKPEDVSVGIMLGVKKTCFLSHPQGEATKYYIWEGDESLQVLDLPASVTCLLDTGSSLM